MTEQNKENQRPDAVPASLSVDAVEPKYKEGDHVWAKRPKELAGRTGCVRAVDTYRMVYEVAFGTEVWKMLEDSLELVDPATEETRQTVFEREDDADQPLTEQAAYDEYKTMRMIYMIAADVLRALGWEVEINEKDSYWNLVLTNTSSSEDMPESHKSCLRGLLRGWLMEFLHDGGRQQVNIYKDLHGLDPEDDRYSCLDTCANRTDNNTPVFKLDNREIFIRRIDRFDRLVLTEPIANPNAKIVETVTKEEYFREVSTLNGKIRELEQLLHAEQQKNRKQKEDAVEFLRKSEACLDAVSAMLECSDGVTHRMRDFYAKAMRKFIGNAKKILRSYADPIPF